jgi:selenide, water dikinase
VHEAGATIVGGHSVTDEEVKFGLAVTGRVHPRKLLTNAAARPGDVLILTKPLGTGIMTTAAKRNALPADQLQPVIDSMCRLNATAARHAIAIGATCATDVTGFGLLGHLSHIARSSNVTMRVDVRAVPTFDGTREALANGMRTGGAERNTKYLEPLVDWGGTPDDDRALLVDPQTSGGLLVAVPFDRRHDYLARVPGAVAIGEVLPRGACAIQLA